jgi:hypothetical protein
MRRRIKDDPHAESPLSDKKRCTRPRYNQRLKQHDAPPPIHLPDIYSLPENKVRILFEPNI